MNSPSRFPLSEYGCRSRTPSPVNRMMSSFAADFREGVDINLGVGYVNENTIPSALIREALEEVLAHPGRYKSPLNYGGPKGSPRAHRVHPPLPRRRGRSAVSPRPRLAGREIIIGPNGATSLLEGLAYVLPPGIVITSDPMYYIYCDFLERRGFTVVTVPERMDGLHADDVAARIDALGADAAKHQLPVRRDGEQPHAPPSSPTRSARRWSVLPRSSRGSWARPCPWCWTRPTRT